jgi:hypothetical protein
MTTQISSPQLLSGARGLILVQTSAGLSKTLAIALDITVTVRYSVKDTYVMSKLNPMGLDPTAIDVDVTIGRCVPVNQQNLSTPTTGGWKVNNQDSGTSAIDLGLEEFIANTLTANALVIGIQDNITGAVTSSVQQARFTGRTLSSGAADVANERLNFTGIFDSGYNGSNTAVVLGYGLG